MSRAVITMVSGKTYDVLLNASSYDLQAVVDEVFANEFFIYERAGKLPKLLKTANIEDIDLV